MSIKKTITFLIFAILLVDAIVFMGIQIQRANNKAEIKSAQSAAIKNIDSTIVVNGTVTAKDQAHLHFQTGGKLISVAFKEGDKISQGQTIAQLDTYSLQRQLTQALNMYKSTRDNFDQAKVNQTNGLIQSVNSQSIQNGSQTKVANPKYNGGDNAYIYLDDIAKRIVDENQTNLDNSVINVEISNYALQLASLTSP